MFGEGGFRVAKWLIPATVLAVGVCLFVGGGLYGALTIGVPGPDEPASVVAQERRAVDRSEAVMAAGLVVSSFGMVGLMVAAIVQAAWRRVSEVEHL